MTFRIFQPGEVKSTSGWESTLANQNQKKARKNILKHQLISAGNR